MVGTHQRGRGLSIGATIAGALWVLAHLASRLEIWFTVRAMATQAGAACSSAGVTLYLASSWIPTLLISCTGLGLGLASAARGNRSRWTVAALVINGGVLAWQVLGMAGVLPLLRHPCLR